MRTQPMLGINRPEVSRKIAATAIENLERLTYIPNAGVG